MSRYAAQRAAFIYSRSPIRSVDRPTAVAVLLNPTSTTIYNVNPPAATSRQALIGSFSSNSTTHQRACFALLTCLLSSCALASVNHASELSHPVPNLVRLDSSIYALSLAARRLSSAGVRSRLEDFLLGGRGGGGLVSLMPVSLLCVWEFVGSCGGGGIPALAAELEGEG